MTTRRRVLGAALLALAWPTGARAAPRVPVVGYLSNGAQASTLARWLAPLGYIDGTNLRIERRVAPEDPGGTDAVAGELVRASVDVLVAFGAKNIDALARLTQTIPIVCGGTADPIGAGYAKSLRRPGGNITGLSYGVPELAEITVGIMRTVCPRLRRLACVVERRPGVDPQGWTRVLRSLVEQARGAGVAWEFVPVGDLDDLARGLAPFEARDAAAYVVNVPESIPFVQAAAVINRRRLPSFCTEAKMAREGGLMSYSIDHADVGRRIAAIIDQLIRGASAGEIPFELPDRTTFVVNRATAKAIGTRLSEGILARATELVD
jgi:putative ABC transport system substrate-binding protein